mgnify:CR=1 FL=1
MERCLINSHHLPQAWNIKLVVMDNFWSYDYFNLAGYQHPAWIFFVNSCDCWLINKFKIISTEKWRSDAMTLNLHIKTDLNAYNSTLKVNVKYALLLPTPHVRLITDGIFKSCHVLCTYKYSDNNSLLGHICCCHGGSGALLILCRLYGRYWAADQQVYTYI